MYFDPVALLETVCFFTNKLKLFVSLPLNENGRVSGGNQAINTLAFEEYLFFVRYQQS
jgi:hypothetical protein